MEALLLSLFISACAALPSASAKQPPSIPITYAYGGYPRIQADIAWGTKPQPVVPTIFDTGSIGFWVYGPNATINDGSQYHFTQGPCNKSVTNYYNWPASSTHSKLTLIKDGTSYGYGGNGKIVSGHYYINDTFSFANTKWPALPNNQVTLANYTMVAQLDDKCAIPESTFDHSILGLAPWGVGGTSISSIGPSFRENLFRQGKIGSRSFSMWFDAAPQSIKGKYQGAAIFGAVPNTGKYSGELVRVKVSPPKDAYIGYYAALPKMTAKGISKPSPVKTIKTVDSSVKQCLLDSGTGQDRLPFNKSAVIEATGLLDYKIDSTEFIAYNGTCDSIPRTATLNYTFPGDTKGKSVTIAVPIRSYARGEFDDYPGFSKNVCGLSLSLDEYGDCVYGAPFFTAAFMAFNDDKTQIALAQGGVSQGSGNGPSSLGAVTQISASQDIPGSV